MPESPGNLLFTVEKIITETPSAKTFVLRPNDENFTYLPGQFLSLIVNIRGREVRRAYSLGSTPMVDPLPFITVKRVENGEMSRYLMSVLSERTSIETLPATGKFFLEKSDLPRDIVLTGAGSGIVPLFGILKQVLTTEPQSVVHLLYSNRRPEDTIYLEQLREWEKLYPERLRISWFFSLSKQIISARLHWDFLENYLLTRLKFTKQDAHVFTCGPDTYMYLSKVVSLSLGFSETHFHKEVFYVKINKEIEKKDFGNKVRRVNLKIGNENYSLKMSSNQTILQVAKMNDIPIPWSCESGQCSTCAMKCLTGEVEMTNNDVLTGRDLKNGLILTCTGHPISDVVDLEM